MKAGRVRGEPGLVPLVVRSMATCGCQTSGAVGRAFAGPGACLLAAQEDSGAERPRGCDDNNGLEKGGRAQISGQILLEIELDSS